MPSIGLSIDDCFDYFGAFVLLYAFYWIFLMDIVKNVIGFW